MGLRIPNVLTEIQRGISLPGFGGGNPVGTLGGLASGVGALGRNQTAREIQSGQEAAQAKVEALFAELRDPNSAKEDVEAALKEIKDIKTTDLTDEAAADVNRLRNLVTDEEGNIRKGPTAIGEAQLEAQRLGEKSLIEGIESESALRGRESFENLLSRGGAGAGARERVGATVGRQSLLEQQRGRRLGAQQRLGIQSEDAARKLGILGALPGQQLGLAGEVRAGQTAAGQLGLSKAQQQAQASQFAQAAEQAQAERQADLLLAGQGQKSKFEAAQVLADAQRRAGNQQGGGGLFGQLLGPLLG